MEGDVFKEKVKHIRSLTGRSDEAAGDGLIELLRNEPDSRVIQLVLSALLPRWLPKLDRYLLTLESWPFDAETTYLVFAKRRRQRMESLSLQIESWIDSENLILACEAVEYLIFHGDIQRGEEVGKSLATRLEHIGRIGSNSVEARVAARLNWLLSGEFVDLDHGPSSEYWFQDQ